MLATNTYKLRLATEEDADALRRLAALDSRAPLAGRVLIGELAGSPAAALSLNDDNVIADPFQRTDHLVACLRAQAGALRAHEATPSLSERIRAALRPRAASDRSDITPQPRLRWTHQPAGTGVSPRWTA